jgi:hypothetical protein
VVEREGGATRGRELMVIIHNFMSHTEEEKRNKERSAFSRRVVETSGQRGTFPQKLTFDTKTSTSSPL